VCALHFPSPRQPSPSNETGTCAPATRFIVSRLVALGSLTGCQARDRSFAARFPRDTQTETNLCKRTHPFMQNFEGQTGTPRFCLCSPQRRRRFSPTLRAHSNAPPTRTSSLYIPLRLALESSPCSTQIQHPPQQITGNCNGPLPRPQPPAYAHPRLDA